MPCYKKKKMEINDTFNKNFTFVEYTSFTISKFLFAYTQKKKCVYISKNQDVFVEHHAPAKGLFLNNFGITGKC